MVDAAKNPRNFLEKNRDRLSRVVSVDRLLSSLLAVQVLTSEESSTVQSEPTERRLEVLLDIVSQKDDDTLKSFQAILENNYPHLVVSSESTVELSASTGKGQHPIPVSSVSTKDHTKATSFQIGVRKKVIGRSTSVTGHDISKERLSSYRMDLRPKSWGKNGSDSEQISRSAFSPYGTHDKAATMPKVMSNQSFYSRSSPASTPDHQQSDYERLRDQCINAMRELDTLKRKHAEIISRCDQAVDEADYFRKQHKAVVQKCDQLVRETHSLKQMYDSSLADKDKIKQDYEEIVLLREQEKIDHTQGKRGPAEVKDSVTDDTIGLRVADSYGTLQKENGALKEELEDSKAEYALISSKLCKADDEIVRGKEAYDKVMAEKEELIIERNALKQQCTAAIRGYEKALRDRDESLRSAVQAQQQRDLALRECDQALSWRGKYNRDVTKLQDERNAAIGEYKLVMSERDSVHKEIEKLNDDLNFSMEQNKKLTEDKDRIQHEAECLRQEICSVLADRDKAVKESYDLKNRLQDVLKEREHILKRLEDMRQDSEMLKQERNAARKERGEAIAHRDKILRECFEVKKLFERFDASDNEPKDALRDQFKLLSSELTKAWNEAEVAMLRRDWAFSERDKIVRELETYREKYEGSLSERDSIIEKLHVLRAERDALKKHNGRIVKDIAVLRQCVTSDISAEERVKILASVDSAIYTESSEYDLETIEFERVSKDESFGFTISGGRDAPGCPDDKSIYVSEVREGSQADGKLHTQDCLLRVNDVDLTNVEFQTAYQAIHEANFLSLTVLRKRRAVSTDPLRSVKLKVGEEKDLGLSIDSGLHIKRIEPNSCAADEDCLSVGDKILTINGTPIENMPYQEAKKLLKTSTVSLTVLKPNASTGSSHRSLTNATVDADKDLDVEIHAEPTKRKSLDLHEIRHFKSPSAPVPVSAHIDAFGPAMRHLRSNSAVSGSSYSSHGKQSPCVFQPTILTDEERAKILRELLAEEERRSGASNVLPDTKYIKEPSEEGEEKESVISAPSKQSWSSSPPPPPHRSNSYMTALMMQRLTQEIPQTRGSSIAPGDAAQDINPLTRRSNRPFSAPGSRQSVTSAGSSTKHDSRAILSPLNINPSDPLALSPRTGTLLPVLTSSNTSVNSGSKTSGSTAVGSSGKGNKNVYTVTSKVLAHVQSTGIHPNVNNSYRRDSEVLSNARTASPVYDQSPDGMQHQVKAFHNDKTYYGTFPGKGKRINLSRMERTPLGSLGPSFPKSSHKGSFQKSTSSHGSLNSSVSSDRGLKIPFSHASTDDELKEQNEEIDDEQTFFATDLEEEQAESTKTFSDERENHSRTLVIEKSGYPLGISIAEGPHGGVFVSAVTEGSVAGRAGIRYCDQLLEYNGINLRCANYEQAALILKQASDSNTVTIIVQYNAHKFLGTSEPEHGSQASAPSSSATHHRHPSFDAAASLQAHRKSFGGSTTPQSTTKDKKIIPIPEDDNDTEPIRQVTLQKASPSAMLGITTIGGNAVGTYVSDIQPDSVAASPGGLRCGDEIIEFNGIKLTNVTAEQATLELGKPVETVHMSVRYNSHGLRKAQEQPGDAFYVRALFDRSAHNKEELSFAKGDILYVTDTIYKGQLGVWKAWLVCKNDESQKKEHGTIPSKMKAEQEVLLRRCSTYGDDKLKGRHSFFRRSKKGSHTYTVSHSRESSDSRGEEAGSSIGSNSIAMVSDVDVVAYQIVERFDNHFLRPVVVLGPMSEPICDKLVMEKPYKFARCLPEIVRSTRDTVEKGISKGAYIDYSLSRSGTSYACITPKAIQEVMSKVPLLSSILQHILLLPKTKHCLLDITPGGLDRLSPLELHPIVVFVKFKSYKHIKELRDGHYIRDKVASKEAKELYDIHGRIDKEYRHAFSCMVHGHSLDSICAQIVEQVQEQQRKTLWVNRQET